jgi:hypothetical protein
MNPILFSKSTPISTENIEVNNPSIEEPQMPIPEPSQVMPVEASDSIIIDPMDDSV